MKIRTKLTLLFFLIVILVITALSISIYFFSADYREQDFHRRLKNRAINITKVLTTVKEVDAGLLKRMEQNNPASLANQYVTIYDSLGQLLYQSEGESPISIEENFVSRIELGKEIWYNDHGFEVLGFIDLEQNKKFTVVALAEDIYGKDALRNLRNILFIAFFISIIIFWFLGWFYTGRVLSPITGIVNEVGTITELNLNQRLDEGNHKDELSKLSQAFNTLLKRLEGVFLSQKYFIANASHEMRTPITVMTGQIEVALIQDRTKEYYQHSLRMVLGGLKKLNGLTNQLLMLAQTSSGTPETNFTLLRIDDIFWDIKADVLKAYPHCEIEILFDPDVDHDVLLTRGDEPLLKVAVHNLMENGCKYSKDHRLIIHLTSQKKGHISAVFTNVGTIAADNIDKIFDPFFRAKDAKTTQGFGLGLSLVYWIAKLHHGSIRVHSDAELIQFSLKLPVIEAVGIPS